MQINEINGNNANLVANPSLPVVTLFRGITEKQPVKLVSITEAFEIAKGEKLKKQSLLVRHLKDEDSPDYQDQKAKLPCFRIGEFNGSKDENLVTYSGLQCFDIDKTGGGFLALDIIEKAKKCSLVFAAKLSASGQGVHVFVKTAAKNKEDHRKYYDAVLLALSEALGVPTDKAIKQKLSQEGKDRKEIDETLKSTEHLDSVTHNIGRAWFLSYCKDEEFYLNPSSQVFYLKPATTAKVVSPKPSATNNPQLPLSEAEVVQVCRFKVDRQNTPSGRNNLVFSLACEFARHGVSQITALSELRGKAEPNNGAGSFTVNEIEKTVDSAYKSKVREFTDAQIISYYNEWISDYQSKPSKQRKKETKETPEQGNDETNDQNKGGSKDKKLNKFQEVKAFIFDAYDIRRNVIAHQVEARAKNETNAAWEEVDDNDIICYLMDAGFTGVERMLQAILGSKKIVKDYDPFKDYFNNLPEWNENQPDHIEHLANFISTKDQHWFNQQFKKALVRTVACSMGVIPFNKQCFTIKSNQNDGKSSFIRFLCPPQLGNYITDHIDVDSKDGLISISQNFIINLDELQGFTHKKLNRTKALLTTDKVKERLPYDKKPTTHIRRASFFASTNNEGILVDETGNVRWLVMDIDHIKHDFGGPNGYNQCVDIDLVYSQAVALLRSGFPFQLTKEEIEKSERNNKAYQVGSAEADLLPEYFEPSEQLEEGSEFLSPSNIIEVITHSGVKTTLNYYKMGRALTMLGFKKTSARVNGIAKRGYWVKRTNQI